MTPPRPRPLEHIRVLDLSRTLAGPWATQNLADLGAEVIKVERPGSGDETRAWGPPWLADPSGRTTGESAYYLSVNRGKKSVTADLAHPGARRLVQRLAERADVVVESFKVGDLARRGLAYEDVRRANPAVIYCSVSGFGQSGPDAARPGYDLVFQGLGGLMSVTGERDDLPGGGPRRVGVAVTDIVTGMYASLAITAAIAHRDRTGEGQSIDLALLDTIVAFGANPILNYWCSDRVPTRHGNAHPNIVPYQVFRAGDRDLVLAVGNDRQFAAFCRVAGRPGLADDPRFRTNPERVRHRDTLVPIVEAIVRERTCRDWVAALTGAGVPCGPVHDLREVFEDPQVRHRGLRVDIPHPDGAPRPTVASPMRFSATPVRYDRPAPRLGEHTREVFRSLLDVDDAELDGLAAEGAI